MRIEGTLAKWDDDRGFGFIAPLPSGAEIFVHISAFPKDGRRPAIGERLTFEIELDRDGKKRAKNLLCPDRATVRSTHQPTPHRSNEKPSFISRAIPFAIVLALAFYGYNQYVVHRAANVEIPASSSESLITAPSNEQLTSTSFRCDGRTHCSQMKSCAEATYFLQNCPNVKMDGDKDGIPCEMQLCTSPISK